MNTPPTDRRVDRLAPAPRVAVIVGSTRPTRICLGLTTWIQQALQAVEDLSGAEVAIRYELLDLADVHLPFLDEPMIPVFGQYEHAHTRSWSELVSGYQGFIYVFPQYNWGYPAVLKNALDFLFVEWTGKPATFASYGRHGGSQAAAQIQTVLRGLRMCELDTHLEIVVAPDAIDSDWQIKDLDALLEPYRPDLQLICRQLHDAFGLGSGAHG